MDRESLISKYSQPRQAHAPTIAPDAGDVAGQGAYCAFSSVKGQRRPLRFRIVDARGVSYGVGYAYLVNWMFTPPDMLSLETTTHLFIIEGRGLDALEELLMDEKLRELRVFNRLRHEAPAQDEPLIERMEVIERFSTKAKSGNA